MYSLLFYNTPTALFQMLKEQRAVCNEAECVYLEFQEVEQSVFEVVLRHIYTGDVIIPEHCELDDVTSLAERYDSTLCV